MKNSLISSDKKRNLESFPPDMIVPDITEKNKGLITAFEEVVGKYGKNTALVYNDETITYEQANKQANQLAYYLKKHVKTAGDKVPIIGVHLNRSIEAVISMLAIFKAGFIYLPLPVSDKISSKQLEGYIDCCSKSGHDVTAILSHDSGSAEIEFARAATPLFLNRKEIRDKIKEQPDGTPELIYNPEETAFIIFSSGSTGKPKGIKTPHADLLNCILAAIGEPYNPQGTGLNVKPGDRVPHLISIGFDASIMEIMLALLTGAELHIMSHDREHDMQTFLKEEGITVGIFTASQMKYLKREAVPELRAAIVTAEGIPQEVVNLWTTNSDFRFIAGYGVSEVTIGSTLGVCEYGEVHAGKPMHDKIKIYICKENRLPGEPVIKKEPGEEGEIYIVSPGLGDYLIPQNAAMEEQALKSRFCEIEVDGKIEKAYQTRDKGKINAQGQITVEGRLDRQLQIYGETFCPEEIENALEYSHIGQIKHIAVDTTTIISSGIVVLYACVLMSEEIENKMDLAHLFSNQLKQKGKKHIPVRWIYELLDSDIKLTANGKLDRSGIPGADTLKRYFENNKSHYLSQGSPKVLPRYQYEAEVAKIFQEIFGLQCELDVKENFYSLGGTSLQWVFLINRLNKEFLQGEKELLPAEVHSPTIEGIACTISELKSNVHFKEYDVDKKREIPLFLVHSLLGKADQDYGELILQLRAEKKDIGTVYTISASGLKCPEEMDDSIERLAEYYIRGIEKRYREKHEGQPLIVLGWSAGGVIANAIVKKLQEKGKKAVAIAVDSAAPSLLREMPIEHFIEKYLIRLVGYETEGFRDQNRNSKMGNEEWKKRELIEQENSKKLRSLYLPASTPELESEIKRIIVETKEGIHPEYDLRTATVDKFFERLIKAIKELKEPNGVVFEQEIKRLETMCSILKSLLAAEGKAAENSLWVVCSNSEAELGECLGWGKGESLAIQRIENANHFSVMKKNGQLAEVLESLAEVAYGFKVEKLQNVLREYYKIEVEKRINLFGENNHSASLEKHYVIPTLKDAEKGIYFYPEKLLIPNKKSNFISGASGAGKSALCLYLAAEWSKRIIKSKTADLARDEIFPLLIWLPLKTFILYMERRKEVFSISNYLYHHCQGCERENLKMSDIEEVLKNLKDQTLYILDGYDEIGDLIEYSAEFKKLAENNYNIITFRPGFSENLLRIIPEENIGNKLELLGFESKDVRRYIEKYFAGQAGSAQKKNSLLEYINLHSDLRVLFSTPMHLQLLCALFEKENVKVEIKKEELYAKFVRNLLNKRRDQILTEYRKEHQRITLPFLKDVAQDVCGYIDNGSLLESAQRVIGELAFSSLKNQNSIISRRDILSICRKMNPNFNKVLFNYVVEVGFLNRVSAQCAADEIYEFIHLGFQEFYAAVHIVEEFICARKEHSHFNFGNLLGGKENKYDAKYKEMWRFALSFLIEKEAEIATDFFELINEETVTHSLESALHYLKNLPNEFSVGPDGPVCAFLSLFTQRHWGVVSINTAVHMPRIEHAVQSLILLISSLEQILQTKESSQKKAVFSEKKERYIAAAGKIVFDIVYNYALIFDKHPYEGLRREFIKIIVSSRHFLGEKLLNQIPKVNAISDGFMKAKVLTFYCDLRLYYDYPHLLGDFYSSDMYRMITEEIFHNFEFFCMIRWGWNNIWNDWGVAPVDPRRTTMRLSSEAKLPDEFLEKILMYYFLDDNSLSQKLYSAYKILPDFLREATFEFTNGIPQLSAVEISDVRIMLFWILRNQYPLVDKKLLALIDKYGKEHKIEHEKTEALKADVIPQYLELESYPTVGDGNCAFHAILWNCVSDEGYKCKYASEARHLIAESIRTGRKFGKEGEDQSLKEAIDSAILSWIQNWSDLAQQDQEDRAYKESRNAREYYINGMKEYQRNLERYRKDFAEALVQDDNVVEYIAKIFGLSSMELSQLSPEDLFRDKFQAIINGDKYDKELLRLIKDNCMLYRKLEQMDQHTKFNFEFEEGCLDKVRREFANFIEKNGQYLSVEEVDILAHVFELTVKIFYSNTGLNECLNEGENEIINICYNGERRGHFEYVSCNREARHFLEYIEKKILRLPTRIPRPSLIKDIAFFSKRSPIQSSVNIGEESYTSLRCKSPGNTSSQFPG